MHRARVAAECETARFGATNGASARETASSVALRRMKLAVLFDNLGPYHIARLTALGSQCDLLAVEQHANSAEYDWWPSAQVPFRRVTLFENAGAPIGSASELAPR